MKILHIVPSYLPAERYGGPIYSVHNLNKWLVKSGAEVTVYTTNADGQNNLDVPLNKEVMVDGVKVIYFPLGIFRGWFYSAEMKSALEKNIGNFDLVHITSVFLSASTMGAYYAKKFNKPYIISPRGSLMTAPLTKGSFKKKVYLNLLEKRNLAGASAIHFTVDLEKEEYLKAGLSLKKAIVIPNGLDISEFREDFPMGEFRSEYNINAETKIVLFLSRISWKKGFDVLIPAFAEVAKKTNSMLVIAGGDDEGYQRTVEGMILKYDIKDRVLFTGQLLGRKKLSAYKDADVFALPSHAENFANVVLEAMAMKLPVIVSPEVGVSSSVLAYGSGLVAKRDINQLSEAILEILENREASKKMGESGRRAVIEHFSWGKIAESFAKEYQKIISQG